MVYEGIVQNGVVVFDSGLSLPEGAVVRVELANQIDPQRALEPDHAALSPEDDALLRMSELAIDMGIPDLAVNIDHYLYGHSKAADDR
jgi:hypothetical protein